ncbi:MAG: protein kinase [Acidobacteria bacterium]|nr:protein kinase [Acidobacteriota bacterium]NIM60375.1 protein kinase [Acidobacteriota bacterium]NIO60310.1 protein kinase [Acidobacteriota bacterium]NIQ31365.1 protein kinase [Acidobacteriota bacterium]NIQ86588.1 protein kinase [Acidobacteriota bacterium]
MVGKTLSHFKVLEKIGEGGMGAVYVAQDRNLGRKVALKVLRGELASNPERLERFRREAQAVAALNHPNIVTIHSIEESAEGSFITMELVEGSGLDKMIAGDGMSAQRMIEIATPLVRALSAAHERGITHRDLKPANIMVTDDGTVKILDFGLAKLTAIDDSGERGNPATQTLTQEGNIVGTVPYMSPEQVQGKPVDHRTDIFSLGVILYEMATGSRPFRGESTADVVSSILRDAPHSIHESRPDMPDRFGRVITRCLEKEPELRYQTAADILTAIAKLDQAVEEKKGSGKPSVAVLPFVDMSPEKDQDYFCEGLAEELINALVAVDDLQVASRTSAFRFKGSQQDIREIGRRLGVSTVLEGSVRKAGSQVRVAVQLVNVADGYHLWSNRYDRELKDVFAIQDEIAPSIVEALQVTLTPKAEKKAEKEAPTDVQAYDYYLKGRKFFYEFRAKGFELARQMFARAIVIDDKYARAYAGVADCCSSLYSLYNASDENLNEADTASRKAVELDPDNAEARASRGLALSLKGDFEESDKEFEKAIALNPKSYEAHYFFARALFAQGRHEDAVKEFEKACEVNPEDYQAPFFLAQTYLSVGRRAYAAANLRKAVEAAKKHLAFNADDARALYLGGAGLVELGELEMAQEWVARAQKIDPDDSLVLYNVACIYAQLGENDQALDCLEKSYKNAVSTDSLNWMQEDPYFDPVRDHPRYKALVAKLNAD